MDSGINSRRDLILTWIRYTVLASVLVFVLLITPFRPLKISGSSMDPTFRNGETYLLDTLYWRSGGVRRGDIVVVRHDDDKWVKRLIGMPNDELQITYRWDGWITGIDNLTVTPKARREAMNIRHRKVEPDEIFVMGDNVNRSLDSTNQEVGAFKLEDILGVVRTFTMRRDIPFRTHL